MGSLLPIAFGLWSLGLSLYILPYYRYGDQLAYRYFYNTREGVSLIDSFAEYGSLLGTQEPGYFLLVSACASWLDKDILMSVVNGAFGYYVGRALVELNASPFVVPLLSINYYLIILYGSAERLKLGILFGFIAVLHSGWVRYAALAASILSHVQNVVLICAQIFARSVTALAPLLRGRLPRSAVYTAAGALLIGIPAAFMMEHALSKLAFYQSRAGGKISIESTIKPALFCVLTIWYAGRSVRARAIAFQIPIVAVTLFVGADRLASFTYLVFMYYGLQVNRGLNVGVITTGLYFAVNGVVAVLDIYNYGTAFYWLDSPLMRLAN